MPLLLEILSIMCIVNICFPVCDIISLKINFSFFLSSCFPTWPKQSEQKCKYLQNKNSFLGEIKSIFQHFKNGFQLPETVSDMKARTVFFFCFLVLEKIQAISLYWFAWQQQTNQMRLQESGLFYAKFSAQFNDLSLDF